MRRFFSVAVASTGPLLRLHLLPLLPYIHSAAQVHLASSSRLVHNCVSHVRLDPTKRFPI